MKSVLFDIEATGLLRCGSKPHCIVMRDLSDPDKALVFDDRPGQPIQAGIHALADADYLIGHNIASYDIPLLKEIYPKLKLKAQVLDTLVLSRLYYPTIAERDYQIKYSGMPVSLYGRHSLAAWGHRLKCYKGDYNGGWSTYSPEMLDYCIQDTLVNLNLWSLLKSKINEYS